MWSAVSARSANCGLPFSLPRKFVVSEMFYSYLRHFMSSGVHHPAVAKHDDVQRRVRSAALKHTLKGVFKKAKFESTQSVAVLTQDRS